MRKGTFSATIAVIVAVLIATFAFSSIALVQGQQHELGAANISLFKSNVQNTEYLVGKTIADALADATFAGSCAYDATNTPFRMRDYISVTLADSHKSGLNDLCTGRIANFDAGDLTAIIIDVDLSCNRTFANGSAITYQKTFSYSKEVQVTDSGLGSCEVIVIDNQSGMEEVNRTE